MSNRVVKNTIIIFNEYFYKEIDLDSYRKEEIIISNTEDCDIKINVKSDKWSFKLKKENNIWILEEGTDIYYSINGIKIYRKKLSHGDEISVKSMKKDEIFKMNFFLDFSTGKENYDKGLLVDELTEVKFGRANNNTIVIEDSLVDEYHCVLKLFNDKCEIIDLGSKYSIYINGRKVYDKQEVEDNDFIIICGYKFLYKDKAIYFSTYNEKILIIDNEDKIISKNSTAVSYPEFIRTPRFIYTLPEDDIEIVAAPRRETKQGLEVLLGLVPMVGMSALTLATNMGGNKIYQFGMIGVTFASSMLLMSYNNGKVKKNTKNRNIMYREYINDKEKVIKDLYDTQKNNLQKLYPTVEDAINTIKNFERRLWEKDINHKDFLEVFIGKGTVPISFKVTIPKEEFGEREDELLFLPNKLKEKYEKIEKMPITINLKEINSIGAIGDKENLNQFLRNLIIEVITYHYYEDVNIACVMNKGEEENWKWMRWLPHVWNKNKKIRFMGAGKESSHYVLNYLNDVLKNRKQDDNNNDSVLKKPHYIMIVTDPSLLLNEEIAEIISNNHNLGLTVIYAYNEIELIPDYCTNIIDILSKEEGKLINVLDSGNAIKFNFECYDENIYEEITRRIAPIYVKEMFSQNTLPKSISLYDLYGVKSARQLPLLENWKQNDVCKTMEAPLGIDTAGEMVSLNIHEKSHGPHGLVAGTTGSGKSEILQSYIISLAINFHPYDVAFILIDYKGGGMANLFRDLPHLIGTITNLDGNMVNRSLALIKSELKRRQRIFSKYDVNHIDGYKKLEKEDKSLEPLPHLIIIADEFAELKSDQPDFMKELVSAARIGRSLGVHLILATQKPSGVVDDQIWSNSKFKLCLKVQDEGDSNEVLKSPVAAHIVDPGRAYFQVGNNEIFQLFQSAWSGAKQYEDEDIDKNDIEISLVSLEGARKIIYSSKEENKGKKAITQLEYTVNHINKVFYANGYKKIDDCWVPPLEDIVHLNNIIKEEDKFFNSTNIELSRQIKATVGIVDIPELQTKKSFSYNFSEDGNLVIIGGPAYGKTTLLQTISASLMMSYTPEEVNLYILDFGTRTLNCLNKSKHVGGVILSDDEEKLSNFIKMIKKEILKRKKLFAEVGASSLVNYKIASEKNLPQIIIMIDNYIALKELYEDYEDDFIYFSREGAALGISMIVTGHQFNNISYRMQMNFKMKTVFTCLDTSEYANIFNAGVLHPSNKKGRAIVEDNGINEIQIALPTESDNEVQRIKELSEEIEFINNKWTGESAKEILSIPDVVLLDDWIKEIDNNSKNSMLVPCGFNVDELEHMSISLEKYPTFLIIGDAKTGKSNMLRNIAYASNNLWNENELIVFDSSNNGLKGIKEYSNVKYYINNSEQYEEIFDYLNGEGERRKEFVEQAMLNDSMLDESDIVAELTPMIILIDNISELTTNIELESKYVDILNKLTGEYSNYNIKVIAASSEEKFKDNQYSANYMMNIKDNQYGLVLDSLDRQTLFDVQLRYGTVEKEILKGDGYLILKNNFYRVKTPKNTIV